MTPQEIRQRYAAGENVAEIAMSAGITERRVYAVVYRTRPVEERLLLRARRRASKRLARLRRCEGCPAFFDPRVPSQRFCSPACARKAAQ